MNGQYIESFEFYPVYDQQELEDLLNRYPGRAFEVEDFQDDRDTAVLVAGGSPS